MASPTRGNRELLALVALFAAFLLALIYYEREGQRLTTGETPSAYNAQEGGVKALYLLFSKQGLHVDRLETSWDALGPQDGLLLLIEPFERPAARGEVAALRRWIEGGGCAFYMANTPSALDPTDTVFGDIAVKRVAERTELVRPANPQSPFTQDVTAIQVQSAVRLHPAQKSGYDALFQDASGAVVIHKPLGKGQIFVAANTAFASNAGVRAADNALFLVDVATATAGRSGRRTILFDEYHHGIGFATGTEGRGGGLLANTPAPLRLAFWHALGLSALLLYNGNRRFGRPRSLHRRATRPSTDYVGSMARLYRRAGAADIALETLYRNFVRELTRFLDVPPDTPSAQLIPLAQKRFGAEGPAVAQLMTHCEQVHAGQRVSEPEMLRLAQQLEQLGRRWNRVGPR